MRQLVTPDDMLGCMTTTMRFLSVSAAPIGSVLSGYCADRFGITLVLTCRGVGAIAATLMSRWLIQNALAVFHWNEELFHENQPVIQPLALIETMSQGAKPN